MLEFIEFIGATGFAHSDSVELLCYEIVLWAFIV